MKEEILRKESKLSGKKSKLKTEGKSHQEKEKA
jgi:hypothetical protein